eukprot:scaffold112691_cov28-Tisochrysis_lutea.AAC.2
MQRRDAPVQLFGQSDAEFRFEAEWAGDFLKKELPDGPPGWVRTPDDLVENPSPRERVVHPPRARRVAGPLRCNEVANVARPDSFSGQGLHVDWPIES